MVKFTKEAWSLAKKELPGWAYATLLSQARGRVEPSSGSGESQPSGQGRVAEEEQAQVPTTGPQDAPVAFVGALPSRMEAARREPFTGPDGKTFNEVYLEPLGLERRQVLLTNVVPELSGDWGQTNEPSLEEIRKWHDWLEEELNEKAPRVVVALGRTAHSVLGERADFVLPHPSAVRRFGDSGEVGRKLRKIGERIRKEAEGGTQSARALANWEANWQDMLPSSGKGKFVYQHHWRGLDEEEMGLTEVELMNTDHSIHGDIRLEGDVSLWGWGVLLGNAKTNRDRELNDKLIGWKTGDKIALVPKLASPKQWLEVGVGKPKVFDPGESGATTEKSAKFFALDSGTYELGVARKHFVEIFLDGKHLKGRYLFQFAPVGEQRRWLIDKPEDQTPTAERADVADVIGELRRKRQRFLIWNEPGGKPQKIDVRTGEVTKAGLHVSIYKADTLKHIVYGAVIDPYGPDGPRADAHNDWIPPADVEAAAHDYLQGPMAISVQHKTPADARVVESWVEPYPDHGEYLKAMRGEPHTVHRRKFGSDVVHSGSWMMGVHLGENEWEAYEKGELNAFSPGGFGFRTPITPALMPEVTIVDLVPERKT